MHDESPQLDPLVGAYYERVPGAVEQRAGSRRPGSRRADMRIRAVDDRLQCTSADSRAQISRRLVTSPVLLGVHYITVFDVARSGFVIWEEPFEIGLTLTAIGVVMFSYYTLRPNARDAGRNRPAALAFLVFALCWSLLAVGGSYHNYKLVRDALVGGRYTHVEGVVEHFKPQPPEGHEDEQFDVGTHHYAFSNYVPIAGYHTSRSHGGVFREGLRVRIADVNGQIARLEVADDSSRTTAP
jgi:hypothetical protein